MRTLYCLECEHHRFYVGETPCGRFDKRLYEHKYKQGAKWTTLHKPIRVLWKRTVADDEVKRLEDEETCRIMMTHGINSVRGGLFNIGTDVKTLPWWARDPYTEHRDAILAAGSTILV